MPFTILTPEGTTYQDDITKVTIPTKAGQITVLPGHAPLVSVLRPGEITVHKEDKSIVHLSVSTGILEIRPDSSVYLLADTSERAEDIDVERAEQARKRAQELLESQDALADVDFARLQAVIDREMARIGTAKKYKG